MIADLVVWLRGVLDQREMLALAAQQGTWISGRTTDLNWGPVSTYSDPGDRHFAGGEWWPKPVVVPDTHVCVNGPGGGMVVHADDTRHRAGNVAHILANQPQQVLADVAADRAFLAYTVEVRENADRATLGSASWAAAFVHAANMVETAVRIRALAYVTWPGYREEWRPT